MWVYVKNTFYGIKADKKGIKKWIKAYINRNRMHYNGFITIQSLMINAAMKILRYNWIKINDFIVIVIHLYGGK